MSKELIASVCKLLGVEIGEKFNVKSSTVGYSMPAFNRIYSPLYIDNYGNVKSSDDDKECPYLNLLSFLKGDFEIVKLPYRPKKGDPYYYLDVRDNGNFIVLYGNWWRNSPEEIAMLKLGWIWRTEDEAKEAIPKVAEAIKQEMERK